MGYSFPYDNAPMERYFNTMKNEFASLYDALRTVELMKNGEKLYLALPRSFCAIYLEKTLPKSIKQPSRTFTSATSSWP